MPDNEIAITVSLVNKIQGELDKAKKQIEGFGKNTEKTGKSISTIFDKDISSAVRKTVFSLVGLGTTLTLIAKKGAEFDEITNAFDNLSKTIGLTGDKLRTSLQLGFKGVVPEMQMMRSANQAILLGLPLTTKNADLLATAARRLGNAVGMDATSAFDVLTRGIATQQERMLRQIGITVDAQSAYEDYAKSLGISSKYLSEADKQTAFLNKTLEVLKMRMSGLGEDIPSIEDDLSKMSADMANLANESSRLMATGIIEFFKTIGGGPKTIPNLIEGMKAANAPFSGKTEEVLVGLYSREAELQEDIAYNRAKGVKEDHPIMVRLLNEQKGILESIKSLEIDIGKEVIAQVKPNHDILESQKTMVLIAEKLRLVMTGFSFIPKGLVNEALRLKDFGDMMGELEKGKVLSKSEELDATKEHYTELANEMLKIAKSDKERLYINETLNRVLRDQTNEILGIKGAEEDLNKAIEEVKLQSPKRMLGEERATRTLGGFSPTLEGMMSQRQLESGQVTGYAYNKDLQSRFAKSQAGILPQLTMPQPMKPLETPKTQTKGAGGEDSKAIEIVKQQSNAVKNLTKTITDEGKKQVALLNITTTNLKKIIDNEEAIITVLEKNKDLLANHEGRIRALEMESK